MTYQDLVDHFGTANKAALSLGYSKQAVSRWKDAGVPFEAQFRAQMKSKGVLKATLVERKRKVA